MGRILVLPGTLAWVVLCTATLAVAAPPPASKLGAAAGTATASVPAATAARPGSTSKPATKRGSPKTKPGTSAAAKGAIPKLKPKQKPGEVMDLDWRDLLPENERSHYSAAAPPPQHGPLGEGGPPAVQKETTTFNEDLADLVVRLPGFVVPIGTPRDGLINEFFLVPYIGACIHVPPPPANQMVYVRSASGIAADAIHEAYWVTGKMRVESRATPLGTAAYAVSATKVDLYEY
jgi:uncharacterized protein